ncbi:MAG: nucleotidyltransferase domain-containing protein [Actinomycetota bacterium]|nr:nucleotidyltransferase domain-containing protein [Actinomycetota bacterium]
MNADTDIIDSLFGGPGRNAVLRLLARSEEPLSGRQIAQATGLSPGGAARALDHLFELGVIVRVAAGRAVLNSLDREHEIVRTLVLPALEAEDRIAAARAARPSSDVPPEIIECLVSGFDPLQIILFGSRATGEGDESSDFDLLVVLPEVTDKHATMVAMLLALGHFAVPVDAVPTDPAEIASRGHVSGTVLATALESGKVVYERVA